MPNFGDNNAPNFTLWKTLMIGDGEPIQVGTPTTSLLWTESFKLYLSKI